MAAVSEICPVIETVDCRMFVTGTKVHTVGVETEETEVVEERRRNEQLLVEKLLWSAGSCCCARQVTPVSAPGELSLCDLSAALVVFIVAQKRQTIEGDDRIERQIECGASGQTATESKTAEIRVLRRSYIYL